MEKSQKFPTKEQTLSRMEWFLNGMKNNSQLRLGLRQNTNVIAIFFTTLSPELVKG